jgi:hypothetical protein
MRKELGGKVIVMSKREYDEMPDSKKGCIRHAVRYVRNERRKNVFGRQDGTPVVDEEFLGNRTLRLGKRVLIEGLTLVIGGPKPQHDEFSLI